MYSDRLIDINFNLEEAIEAMAKDGVKRVVAFSQYPQYL